MKENKTHLLYATAALVAAITLAGLIQGYAEKIYEPYTFTTIAGKVGVSGGSDGIGSAARFYVPQGLAIDKAGNLYVTEWMNCTVRKATLVGTNWVVTTLAGKAGSSASKDGMGNIARFSYLSYPVVDSAGNLYVPDFGNHTIRKIAPVGTNWVVTTLAGKANAPGSDDGTNGTARFYGPSCLAMDSAGSLYVADSRNNTIRKMTPVGSDWVVTTLAGFAGQEGCVDGINDAARFAQPFGLTIDKAGKLYVADFVSSTIRRVTPEETEWGTDWAVTTLAGSAYVAGVDDGIGNLATFDAPASVAVDSMGSVYVSDFNSHTIRKMTPVGNDWMVTTLAGQAYVFGSTDRTGNRARFNYPANVIVDSTGRLFVADTQNQTVRMGFPAFTITPSGFTGGQFGFTLKGGPSGQTAVVETSADMVGWLPIWTNTLGGTLNFSDPQSSGQARRFYRANTQ